MIDHVLAYARQLEPHDPDGRHRSRGRSSPARIGGAGRLTFVVQEPQLGTAHALQVCEPVLREARGALVLLSGDVPHLRVERFSDWSRTTNRHRRP